jgi:hypothetical protein
VLSAEDHCLDVAPHESHVPAELDSGQRVVSPPFPHCRHQHAEELGDLGRGHQLGPRESARRAEVVERELRSNVARMESLRDGSERASLGGAFEGDDAALNRGEQQAAAGAESRKGVVR